MTRLNTNKTIDDTNQKIMESEQEYWTNILQRIISVVKFFAQRSLAFGDHQINSMSIIMEIF